MIRGLASKVGMCVLLRMKWYGLLQECVYRCVDSSPSMYNRDNRARFLSAYDNHQLTYALLKSFRLAFFHFAQQDLTLESLSHLAFFGGLIETNVISTASDILTEPASCFLCFFTTKFIAMSSDHSTRFILFSIS